MKNLKIILTLMVTLGIIAGTSVVQAITETVDVTAAVDPVSNLSTCGTINLGAMDVDSTLDNTASPCTISAYSNSVSGFTISINGTEEGLENQDFPGTELDKISTTTGTMNICSSSCTEAWGFRITNGSASEYDTVETDTDNKDAAVSKTFDESTCGGGADDCWHTVNYPFGSSKTPNTAETIITHGSPIVTTAEFDLEVRVVSGSTVIAVDYLDTLTLTQTLL